MEKKKGWGERERVGRWGSKYGVVGFYRFNNIKLLATVLSNMHVFIM